MGFLLQSTYFSPLFLPSNPSFQSSPSYLKEILEQLLEAIVVATNPSGHLISELFQKLPSKVVSDTIKDRWTKVRSFVLFLSISNVLFLVNRVQLMEGIGGSQELLLMISAAHKDMFYTWPEDYRFWKKFCVFVSWLVILCIFYCHKIRIT